MSGPGLTPDGRPAVRPARDADGPGLIALVGSCFSEYEGCILDTDREMPHLLAVASLFAAGGGGA